MQLPILSVILNTSGQGRRQDFGSGGNIQQKNYLTKTFGKFILNLRKNLKYFSKIFHKMFS